IILAFTGVTVGAWRAGAAHAAVWLALVPRAIGVVLAHPRHVLASHASCCGSGGLGSGNGSRNIEARHGVQTPCRAIMCTGNKGTRSGQERDFHGHVGRTSAWLQQSGTEGEPLAGRSTVLSSAVSRYLARDALTSPS